jgi:hypothetical protein
VDLAADIDCAHGERMDHALLGCGQALRKGVFAVFIHHEADRAAVHSIDRLAGLHEFVQGLEHQAIAAERHDNVGVSRGRIAITARQCVACCIGFRYGAGDERDAIAALSHGCQFLSLKEE